MGQVPGALRLMNGDIGVPQPGHWREASDAAIHGAAVFVAGEGVEGEDVS
jgi:hypothetical protein